MTLQQFTNGSFTHGRTSPWVIFCDECWGRTANLSTLCFIHWVVHTNHTQYIVWVAKMISLTNTHRHESNHLFKNVMLSLLRFTQLCQQRVWLSDQGTVLILQILSALHAYWSAFCLKVPGRTVQCFLLNSRTPLRRKHINTFIIIFNL